MDLRGINHIVLQVRNLEVSDRFYRQVLGLEKVGERGRIWFYSAGGHHHDLALLEIGEQAQSPPRLSTGLFHFCFDVADEDALGRLYRRCREAGAPLMGSVDHNISRSFYLRDPDGHMVELTVDVPREQWANQDDPFADDLPYEPEKV